jgi:lysophospholipase L1-like esterase
MNFLTKKWSTYFRTRQFLLVSNLVTLGLLLSIIVVEKYPNRIYTHFFDKQKVGSFAYSLNPQFKEQVDYCSILKRKSNIVMFGNSLTYRMNWSELLERCDIANRGVGSDITSGLIERLKFVIPLQAKVCFIEAGVNDLERNIDTTIILKNLITLIDSLEYNAITPVLTMVTYVTKDYPNSNTFNQQINLLNNSYRTIATKRQLETIDLNNKICKNKTLLNEYAEDDGIHLKSRAYLIWKEQVIAILTKLKI